MRDDNDVRKDAARGLLVLGIVAGVLLVQGILRVWVGIELLTTPGVEGALGALVHWRVYDSFAGWVGVLVLAMAGVRRGNIFLIEAGLLALGLIGMVAGTFLGMVEGRALFEIVVSALLAAGTLTIAIRQILALGRAAGKEGLDVEQLWRGAALQWVLLWVTVEVLLRIRFSREGIESDERARQILFLVPALGVIPNVMMATGIRWWNIFRGSPASRPRVRGWLVSMVALNLGALVCVGGLGLLPRICTFLYGDAGVATGESLTTAAMIVGTILMLMGMAIYFVGFPRGRGGAWRGGGGGVLVSFLILGIGVGMMGFDRFAQIIWYSAAWRHLIGMSIVIWLMGMGWMAAGTIINERVRPTGAGLAAMVLVILGVMAIAAVFGAGIWEQSSLDRAASGQGSVVDGLFVGAVLETAGIIVAGAALLRGSRGLKDQSTLSKASR